MSVHFSDGAGSKRSVHTPLASTLWRCHHTVFRIRSDLNWGSGGCPILTTAVKGENTFIEFNVYLGRT